MIEKEPNKTKKIRKEFKKIKTEINYIENNPQRQIRWIKIKLVLEKPSKIHKPLVILMTERKREIRTEIRIKT